MIALTARGSPKGLSEVIVAPVTRGPDRRDRVLILDAATLARSTTGEAAALIVVGDGVPRVDLPIVSGVRSADHLSEGDIVALHPSGLVETLFRVESQQNTLFVTNQCNSRCVMCSQPPTEGDDVADRMEINLRLARLIPKTTCVLGITGGEPTLLGDRLGVLLRVLGEELPSTEVHILSNGRAFAWPGIAEGVAAVCADRIVFGIPLYSDIARRHDYVVQAKNAFSQTVLGLHSLARSGIRVEIRTVLQKQTVGRLLPLARFIHCNVPFAEHITFMGMEHVGYAVHNSDLLWMEPKEYVTSLVAAVEYLTDFGFNVSVYNLPLCLVPSNLWPFCRQSISDWKREYLPVCQVCDVKATCGGVFGTSRRQSALIAPAKLG